MYSSQSIVKISLSARSDGSLFWEQGAFLRALARNRWSMTRREHPQPSLRWGTKAGHRSFCRLIFSNNFSFHVVRFELKIAVTLPLTEEKCKAIFWPTAQIKHWGGLQKFWKAYSWGQERRNFLPRFTIYDDENNFSGADSSLEIQINLARCHWKSFLKPNFLSEIAQRAWRWTLRGRCYHLNRRGKEAEQWRFWRANLQK